MENTPKAMKRYEHVVVVTSKDSPEKILRVMRSVYEGIADRDERKRTFKHTMADGGGFDDKPGDSKAYGMEMIPAPSRPPRGDNENTNLGDIDVIYIPNKSYKPEFSLREAIEKFFSDPNNKNLENRVKGNRDFWKNNRMFPTKYFY